MSEPTLTIQSHKGPYQVRFENEPFAGLAQIPESLSATLHFIVDQRVAALYAEPLAAVLKSHSVLMLEANEPNKSFAKLERYVDHLLEKGVRKGHTLVAIGGGVIQDVTCFLASTLFRGMRWQFYPTTLLAQADSCIGSKSSVNVGQVKNLLGTFHPPVEIVVSTRVLKTLDAQDIRSGIGEMLKVHVIDGPASFVRIAKDYSRIAGDPALMTKYIRASLKIKKSIIEQDEFDTGLRNVMNYGHSFGHAIEAATSFGVPHGIAVTLGMDLANFVASELGRITLEQFAAMHGTLSENYRGFEKTKVPLPEFLGAIGKDKKNVGAKLGVILPRGAGGVERVELANDDRFQALCAQYFERVRTA